MQRLVAQYQLQSRLVYDAETPLEYLNLQRIRHQILRDGFRLYGQPFLTAIS